MHNSSLPSPRAGAARGGMPTSIERPEPGQVSRLALLIALDRLAAIGRAVSCSQAPQPEQEPVTMDCRS